MKIFRLTVYDGEMLDNEINWFTLPDSTVIRTDNPFFVPDFDTVFKASFTLAVKIGRLGKSIAPRFAHRYYAEATIAVTAHAGNLLDNLKRRGLPWDRAVSFDRCCMVGDFLPIEEILSQETTFAPSRTSCCGIKPAVSDIDRIISLISRDNTLKIGDLILIPLAGESIVLAPGQEIKADCGSKNILEIRVR